MIPLTDADRRPVNLPVMTLLLIVINFIVFFLELAGGDAFVSRWALVPAHITAIAGRWFESPAAGGNLETLE